MRQLTYGVVVETDVDLGVPRTDRPAELTIRRSECTVAGSVAWVDRTSDGWMRGGQVDGCLYLGFGDEAEFVIAADGRTVRWHRAVKCAPDTLVHLLLDHVLPRVLTRRLDPVVLHGSCVDPGDGGCVALLGRSGSGKSTLAAALMARGCHVVADDCVVVRWCDHRPMVTSAYPGLRLTDRSVALSGVHGMRDAGAVSSHNTKSRMLPPDGGHSAPGAQHLLRAVVVLGHPHDGPTSGTLSEPLDPAAAGIELLRHSLHLNAPEERASLLRRVLPLAEEVPVYRMHYDHTALGLELALGTIRSVLPSLPDSVATR